MAGGLAEAIDRGMAGYGWMDRVLQTRKERATTEQTAQSKRALAERMAQGPASLGAVAPIPTPTPTPGGAISGPDTTGAPPVAPTKFATGATAPTGGGAIPGPGTTGAPPVAEPTPGPSDPDVNQFELETKQRTGRDAPMGKDWNAFRQDLLSQAAGIGDPQVVAMIDEYVSSLQNKGFTQNASRAQMAASLGDQKSTAFYLQKAFGYLNTGDAPRIQPVADGKFVVMPVDEDTGKPSGNPLVLDAKAIGGLVAMAADPVKFAEWKTEAEADAKKQEADITKGEKGAAVSERQVTTEEKRASETERHNRATEGTARITAGTKRLITTAKKSGIWNDPATRALTNDVNRQIETRKNSASDEIFDLYDEMGPEIASDVINLAKYSEDYDLPKFMELAERAAQNGHTFELDQSTGEIIVVTPVGDIALEDY